MRRKLRDDGVDFIGSDTALEQIAHFSEQGDRAIAVFQFLHPHGLFVVRLLQSVLGEFALANIADVALDHFGVVNLIYIADKFHVDAPSVFGLKRQILVTNVSFLLQFSKGGLAGFDISHGTDFPKFLSQELVA